jgi:hypothetical protein
MGTNDIKLLVDGKASKKKISVNGELRDEILPMSIGEFVSKVYSETLREFVEASKVPCCWFGGGFSGTPASQIAMPQNERFLVTALAEPQKNAALGCLFNALNLHIARVARQCFDPNGKALGRVSVFGILIPDQPHTMTIAGQGHAVSRF